MKIKPLLPIIALAIMVALGACSNEELMLDTKPTPNPQTGRTLSFTASMPGGDPTTRVALVQEADNSITLTWEVGDKLQLAFVQGATKVKETITLTTADITHEGRRATLSIEIPNQITDDTTFDLYGVYGGGKRTLSIDIGLPGNNEQGDVGIGSFYSGDALVLGDAGTNPYIKLPSNAGSATSLTDIQRRKDVMLYFESIAVDLKNPDISVMFQHLGSLFSITLKNNAATSLDNLKEVQLVGINNPENKNWAYNGATGGQTYDLITKVFNTTATVSNHISFRAAQNSVPADGTITFWGWYPPMPENSWPELELQLIDATKNTIATSSNTKPARTSEVDAGKAYYFYAKWDGAKLNFSDEAFIFPLGKDEYHVAEMGTLATVLGDEQATITKLILKGQINAADFATLKSLPNLTYLDLKEVTCDGDTIPDRAFESKRIKPTIKLSTIILPESITAIGDSAFYYCAELAGSLIIPDNVATIGIGAFYNCSNLSGMLTIPNKVTTIGSSAFNSCENFSSLIFQEDSKLTTIGTAAFLNCYNLSGMLTIPNKVTTIGIYAFAYCEKLSSLIFQEGSNLVTIESDAFSYCSGFTGDLIIPATVTSIGQRAFRNCTGFKGSLVLGDELLSIDKSAFQNCSGFTGSLTIPAKVTTIGAGAFLDCSGFNGSLTTLAGLESINDEAFKNCSNFTSLTLGEGLLSIKVSAFNGCTSFTGDLIIPATVTLIRQSAFQDCTGFKGSLILGAELNWIYESAFQNCSGFTGSLTIPAKVISIEKSAFLGCSGFNGSLTTFGKLSQIKEEAFKNCSSFTSLNLGEGLRNIQVSAFSGCSAFSRTVVFPSTLENIGSNGFTGCTSVDAFQFLRTAPIAYNENMLLDKKPVTVPTGTVAVYQSEWGDNANRHVITAAIE